MKIQTSAGYFFSSEEPYRHEVEYSIVNEDEQWLEELKSVSQLTSGDVAIICNTVKNAVRCYDYIVEVLGMSPEQVHLNHSKFTVQDRMENDLHLLQSLGKGQKTSPKEVNVYIGTQVFEQSLDVDFDFMVTELAPMDLILQRVGRLHRHSVNTRPAHFAKPRLRILTGLTTIVESSTSELIYGAYHLAKTLKVLEQRNATFNIPSEISSLVQQTHDYHDSELDDLLTESEAASKNKRDRASVGVFLPSPGLAKHVYNTIGKVQVEPEVMSTITGVRDGTSGPSVLVIIEDDGVYSYLDGTQTVTLKFDSDHISWDVIKKIKAQEITLPLNFINKVQQLEKEAPVEIRTFWKENSFLQNEIPLIFRKENADTFINSQHNLVYSRSRGLIEIG